MREIEFRAKDFTGEWRYGYIARYRNYKNEVYTAILPICDNETQETSIEDITSVDSNTIGQYTGLKDKNGTKIFEGDIVIAHYFFENYDPVTLGAFEDEDEITGKIVCGLDGLRVVDRKDEYRQLPLSMIQEPTEELEVIGNIYDNVELLGE